METQNDNSTHDESMNPQKKGEQVLNELMDMEVLIRHMMSKEYQQALENELVTPMIAQLILQKLHKASDIITGSGDIPAALAQ